LPEPELLFLSALLGHGQRKQLADATRVHGRRLATICRGACLSRGEGTKTPRRAKEQSLERKPDVTEVPAFPRMLRPPLRGWRQRARGEWPRAYLPDHGLPLPFALPPFRPPLAARFLLLPFPLAGEGVCTGASPSKCWWSARRGAHCTVRCPGACWRSSQLLTEPWLDGESSRGPLGGVGALGCKTTAGRSGLRALSCAAGAAAAAGASGGAPLRASWPRPGWSLLTSVCRLRGNLRANRFNGLRGKGLLCLASPPRPSP